MYRVSAFRRVAACSAASLMLLVAACQEGGGDADNAAAAQAETVPVTITMAGGETHVFQAEVARTDAEQKQGLMYRTGLGPDFAMLFAPYPAIGDGPREAAFWMQNTPTSLDIIFIRPDGTIARIAENTVPFSSEQVRSYEPVSAVLEVVAGRAAALGISPGDRVSWPGQGGG